MSRFQRFEHQITRSCVIWCSLGGWTGFGPIGKVQPVERTKQIAEELVKLFGHSTLTAEEIAGYFRVTPSQVHRRLWGIAMRIGCVRRYRAVDIAEALAGPWTRDAA